jgi:metal-responsive CopG/Arc/MetJ family transcriptional regulator
MARIGRPRKGDEAMPQRTVRMDDTTWDRVGKAATEDGTTRSDVIRDATIEHLDKRDAERGE